MKHSPSTWMPRRCCSLSGSTSMATCSTARTSPIATENGMDRLTVQWSVPTASADLRGVDSVSISTKFIELALNILDPDFTGDEHEKKSASDEATRYLSKYPITDWETEVALGLVVRFVNDWATGEFSNFAPTNGSASVITPSSNYHLDTFDFVIDEGPTSELETFPLTTARSCNDNQ